MTNNNQKFYTVIAFTAPKLINDQYSCIASSHYLTKDISVSLKSDTMANRLDTLYNNKLKIIIVTDDVDNLKSFLIGNSFSSPYSVFILPSKHFYTQKFINDAFLNNNDINHSIFLFKDLDYRDIVANLATFNILVSGGSNSKKHIISPIQLRLSRFIIALSPFIATDVAESFHFERESGKARNNWSSKQAKSLISKLDENSRNKFINRDKELENMSSDKTEDTNISMETNINTETVTPINVGKKVEK